MPKSNLPNPKVQNRFAELLAVKERLDGKSYNQREIGKIINVATGTVGSYLRQEPLRYDMRVVAAICHWLRIHPSEFFTWDRDPVYEDQDSIEDEDDESVRMPIPA